MKPKILHLITGLDIGGAEMMLQRTLPLLTNFEHLVCFLRQENSFLVPKFRQKKIRVQLIEGSKRHFLKAIFDFRKVVKKEKPDILVTYLIQADFLGRALGKICGIKKVICSIRSSLEKPKFIPWLLLNTLTSPLVDWFLTNSQSSKEVYSKKWKIPLKKIVAIYNGIELERFNQPVDVTKKKKELKIAPQNYVIGNVGKLRKERGQRYLIEALPTALKAFPNLTLLLAGDGEERQALEKLAKDLGIKNNVMFLGNREDIPQILKTLDIFVNPSLIEGMSNALMEAMASKCAIIASNIPPNREAIENKKSGLLVLSKNPEKLASAVIYLLKKPNLRRTYSENAFQTVREKFSLQETIRELDDFFRLLSK